MANPVLPPLNEGSDTPVSDLDISNMESQAQRLYQSSVAHGRATGVAGFSAPTNPPPAFAAAQQTIPSTPPEGASTPGAGAPSPQETAAFGKKKPAAQPEKVEEPSVWGFIKDASRGGWREIAAGAAEAGATAGHTLSLMGATVLRGAAVQAAADQAWDEATTQAVTEKAGDIAFDFDRDYVKPAIEHWQPKADSGAIAQGLHNASNMASYAAAGPMGASSFLMNSFSKQATDDIDAGKDMRTTLVDATVTAAGNAVLMRVLGKDFAGRFASQIPTAAIRRIVSAIPAGDLVNMGTDLTKKWMLEITGNHKEAEKIDVTQHLTNLEEAVQNIVFGVIGGRAPQKPGAAPPPPPEVAKAPEPAEMPPPPADHAQVTPQQAAAKNPAQAAPPVPDTPTGEPAGQLRAQFVDMNRGATPRTAVLITPESAAHLDTLGDSHPVAGPVSRLIANAKAQGRVVEMEQGDLVTKTKAVAASVKSRLSAGEDPQSVIGSLTVGADGPKTPEHTAVVQGREITDGSITHEKAVKPDEVQAEMQKVVEQGKLPVVTTPDQALQERVQGIREEQTAAVPKPGETPAPDTSKGEIAAPTPSNEAAPIQPPPEAAVQLPAEPSREGSGPVTTGGGGTALDQLGQALQLHEKQEAVPEGKAKSAPQTERLQNASDFAKVLKAAAKEAGEKKLAPDEAVARATEAAKRAERLGEKTPDEIAKSRGTSRVLVTNRVREMHKAARQLMGTAKPGDEVTEKPHEEIARKRAEKKAAQASEPAKPAAPKTERKEPTARSNEPTAQEQAKASRLLSRAIAEEDSDKAKTARDALEQHIHDVAARLGTPDNVRAEQVREVMHFLQEQRKAAHQAPGGRLSDTLEDEEQEFQRPEEGFSTVYRPSVGGKGASLVWHRVTSAMRADYRTLGERMKNSGMLNILENATDSGRAASYHQLLDHMIKQSEGLGSHVTGLLSALRSKAPDVPVFPRGDIVHPRLGKAMTAAKGLFVAQIEAGKPKPFIQVKMNKDPASIVHTIIHEGFHAASEFELGLNPHGPFAKELTGALEILRNRLRSMYGSDVIDQHIAYWNKTSVGGEAGVVPEGGVKSHLYGITNIHELITEMYSNPEFMQEIIDSETFAQPNEGIPHTKGLPGLLMKIFTTMARMLGVNDPKLLAHLIDITHGIMGSQRVNPALHEMYETGAFRQPINAESLKNLSAPALRASVEERELMREAPVVKAEGTIRAAVGDEGVESARDSAHAIKSRSIDMARNVLFHLKTVGQIFRDGKDSFGPDDETNPLNQLKEVYADKNKVIQQLRQVTTPVAKAWMRLPNNDNLKVGQLMIDTTMYKIDPREDATSQPAASRAAPGFEARHAEYRARYDALSPEARAVYDMATDANRRIRIEERRIAIDTALEAFDLKATPEELAKLRSARDPDAYDRLIGQGKEIDFGEKNDKFVKAMKEWAGATQLEGPYHHLGRQGDYVVQATPEGTKEFGRDKAKAEAWAQTAREMSPNAKAEVEERGGKWVVDYKVQHVSMHRTRFEAEKAQKVLEQAGFDPGSVTKKSFTRENAPLSQGMSDLMSEAIRKINRNGQDKGTEALRDSLSSAFMQMQAQRSAYAGSRLMRKNVGGVKASDMRQNFAEHASSSIWHAAQIRTLFKQATAQARLREMARDRSAEQKLAYRRGEVVEALNNHAADEVKNFGVTNPLNRQLARLGFLNYLVSPAHAAIWLTQNMTTGIPWAGARYGYGRSTAAFMKGMAAVTGPALRKTMNAVIGRGGDSEAVHAAIVEAIKGHPTMGKWADAVKQLGDRGVISHGYANELGELAHGGNPYASRAMDWARLLPHMADAINRVSTALAGLELTGGDLRKTAEMIETIHADYSQQNKPLAFKKVNRVWGLNSLTMMKTYAQEMAHLTYSNLAASVRGQGKQAKWEAAKTVAGLAVGNALFAGVYGAVALEPIRFLLYAYHKMFDDEGEVWDLKNTIHHFLVDHFGSEAGNALARGPISQALGVDVSSRMGLANLFFHDPPDILSSDKDMWKTFVMDQAGPGVQMIANTVTGVTGHLQNGEYAQAVASAIPVKVFQDGLKALELMQTGKRTGAGAAITQPSTADAIKQVIGFKPASVAEAQEKQGVQAEYRQAEGAAKRSIIKAFAEGADGAEDRLNDYNSRNPTNPITTHELQSYMRRIESVEEGIPNRNQKAEEASQF